MRLTDRSLVQLPLLEKGQRRIRDDLLPGFGVTVGTRRKTFFVMYGKDRRLQTLGHYPAISLKSAREEARKRLADPKATNDRKRLTEAISAYLEDCQARVRPNTLREYRRHLDKAPEGKLLANLKREDVDLTEPHAVNAWKVFYNWCLRQELADRNPFLHVPVKYGKRDRVLSDDELKALWAYQYPPYSQIVRCLILTGQRVNQFANFDHRWIVGDTIQFPAEVMKSGRPHTIPLTPLIKANLPTGSWGGWSKSKARMDRDTGVSGYVLHDLRRSFATIHARIGTPVHVIEAQLDHSSGTISGVAAIYIRHNFLVEMRKAASTFEGHLASIGLT